MSVRLYTDIIIKKDHFLIVESEQKPLREGLALHTLSRIEEVIRKRLKYADGIEDLFSKLPQNQLYAALKQRATSIKDRYMEKTAALPIYIKFFPRVIKNEKIIHNIFDKIVNLAEPSPLLKLDDEWIQYIFGFVGASALGQVAQVSKQSESHANQAKMRRAREYGYRGDDFTEAKIFFRDLLQSISILVKDGYIPQEYVVRRGRWPFWRYVDSEATLITIRSLEKKNQDRLKAQFSLALFHYVEKGDELICKQLIQYGVDTEIRDKNGLTPLCKAAFKGHENIVKILIDHGANINTTTLVSNATPLILSIHYGRSVSIARLLLENGASATIDHIDNTLFFPWFNVTGGHSALHYAIENNLEEIVELLLNFGADVELPNHYYGAPLFHAIDNGHENIIRILIDHGANVNATMLGNNTTPLLLSIVQKSVSIVRLLLENGAAITINQMSGIGYAPLHRAALVNSLEIAELLLQYGADKNLLNRRDNKTAYQLASCYNPYLCKLLQ